MKKILIMLAVLFMASTVSVNAQDDDKAKAKAEAKAKKAEEKAKKKAEKADKKAEKNKKIIEEYGKFMETYKPLKETGFADVDAIVVGVNGICASLNGIYDKVGYIEIETVEIIDEGEPDVKFRIYHRKTGEEISKDTAKQRFKEVSSEILPLVTSATNLGVGIAAINPTNLIALGPQVMSVYKQAKFIIKVVPAIDAQIKENKEILKVE